MICLAKFCKPQDSLTQSSFLSAGIVVIGPTLVFARTVTTTMLALNNMAVAAVAAGGGPGGAAMHRSHTAVVTIMVTIVTNRQRCLDNSHGRHSV